MVEGLIHLHGVLVVRCGVCGFDGGFYFQANVVAQREQLGGIFEIHNVPFFFTVR